MAELEFNRTFQKEGLIREILRLKGYRMDSARYNDAKQQLMAEEFYVLDDMFGRLQAAPHRYEGRVCSPGFSLQGSVSAALRPVY